MRMRILATLAISLLPLPLLADTTYTYTGNDFTVISGASYSTSDYVSGSFTVSTPLGDDLSADIFTPTSFDFTDGVDTITNATGYPYLFYVWTDASGDITNWDIFVVSSNEEEEIFTINSPGGGETNDEGYYTDSTGHVVGEGYNNNEAGAWSETSAAVTPEPSTLTLLGTGVLGLAGVLRRKFQRA